LYILSYLLMKQYILLARCLLLTSYWLLIGLAAHAQAPDWQAAIAISAPGTGSAYTNATATNAAGDIYVAGQFNGTVSLGTFSLTSPSSGNNGFIAKWSPTLRQFSWAQQVGGSVTGVAVVGTNVYATGYFYATALFGATTFTSAGDYDIFVVKLVDTGSSSVVAWTRQAGGVDMDRAETIAATSSGVYVGGQCGQPATFGTTTLAGSSSRNAFVTKLMDNGSTGDFTWTQQIVDTSATSVYGLAVAGDNVYLSGQFSAAASFGSIVLTTTAANTAYVAKLVDAGATSSFRWAQAPTATGSTYGLGIAVAGTNVYMVGKFTGAPSFGTQTLTTAGRSDIYIAKLIDGGSMGSFVWAQRAGGPDDDSAQKVTVISSNLYLTGAFSGTASFGATSLTSNGGGDIFLTQLTDTGLSAAFAWTQQAGGSGNDSGRDIAMSGKLLVVVGSFNATANFGTQAITNAALYSENAFMALLERIVLSATSSTSTNKLEVFPNPAHTSATIRLPAVPGASQVTFTLLDALGRAVRTQAATAGTTSSFDLTGLTPGLYAIRVQAGKVVATQKLLVQ
jgi:hypothetical protein